MAISRDSIFNRDENRLHYAGPYQNNETIILFRR